MAAIKADSGGEEIVAMFLTFLEPRCDIRHIHNLLTSQNIGKVYDVNFFILKISIILFDIRLFISAFIRLDFYFIFFTTKDTIFTLLMRNPACPKETAMLMSIEERANLKSRRLLFHMLVQKASRYYARMIYTYGYAVELLICSLVVHFSILIFLVWMIQMLFIDGYFEWFNNY